MHIHWSARARRHLISIRNFIATDNPAAAATVAARLSHAVELLRDQPYIGRLGRIPGTRELVITGTPYVVAYTLLNRERVEILAVMHGAQKWPATF